MEPRKTTCTVCLRPFVRVPGRFNVCSKRCRGQRVRGRAGQPMRDARNAEMIQLRGEGWSVNELARTFKISKQRVSVILRREAELAAHKA